MKQLDPENERLLVAAQGYLELGLPLEANNEIESMSAEVRHLPAVLEMRVGIYRKMEKWELMQVVAKSLTEVDPTESRWPLAWAYATRRAESVDAARFILIEAWQLHKKEPLIPYNLACYLCQMGEPDIAKDVIRHAFELDPKIRLQALEDEDLKPLWDAV